MPLQGIRRVSPLPFGNEELAAALSFHANRAAVRRIFKKRGGSAPDLENDAPCQLATPCQRHRLGKIVQQESPRNRRVDLALLIQAEQVTDILLGKIGLDFIEGPHVDTYHRCALEQSQVGGDLRDISSRETNDQQPSFPAQRTEGRFGENIPDRIENNVEWLTPVGVLHVIPPRG